METRGRGVLDTQHARGRTTLHVGGLENDDGLWLDGIKAQSTPEQTQTGLRGEINKK
jgi:hypothetical protein